MTSDAKLGLLLGLVIIIAIVFSVNGLPKFLTADQNNAPTVAEETPVVRVPTEDIISTAKDTIRLLDKYTLPLQEERHDGKSYNIEIPPQMVKAQADAQAKALAEAQAMAAKQQTDEAAKQQLEAAPTTDLQKSIQAKQTNEYVVKENENLGVIARKFYGPEEGNKRANILKIAEYNGLKSPDCIAQGQTLKIPQLSDRKEFVKVDSYAPAATDSAKTPVKGKNTVTTKTADTATTPVDEENTTVTAKAADAKKATVKTKTPVTVKAADTKKVTVTAKATPNKKTPVLTKIRNSLSLPTVSVTQIAETNNVAETSNVAATSKYVVKKGDTLWIIAQKKLGDGSKFPEIVKLNKNISGSSSLKPGTEIELPTR